MAQQAQSTFVVKSVLDASYAMSKNITCTIMYKDKMIVGLVRGISMEDGSGASFIVDMLVGTTIVPFYVRF